MFIMCDVTGTKITLNRNVVNFQSQLPKLNKPQQMTVKNKYKKYNQK